MTDHYFHLTKFSSCNTRSEATQETNILASKRNLSTEFFLVSERVNFKMRISHCPVCGKELAPLYYQEKAAIKK